MAEHVVVRHKMLEGFLQELRVELLPGFKQYRLIPVVRVWKLLLEEPALKRKHWNSACDQTLLSLDELRCTGRGCQLRDRLAFEDLFGGEGYPCLVGS